MAAASSSSSHRATFGSGVSTIVSSKELEFQRITALVRHDIDELVLQRSFLSVPFFPPKRQHRQRELFENSVRENLKEAESSNVKTGFIPAASEQLNEIQHLLIQQNRQMMRLVRKEELQTTLQQKSFHLIKLDGLNDSESSLKSQKHMQIVQSTIPGTYETNGASNASFDSRHFPTIKWLQKPHENRLGQNVTGETAAPSGTIHRKALGHFVRKEPKKRSQRLVEVKSNAKSMYIEGDRFLFKSNISNLAKSNINHRPEGTPKDWTSCKSRCNALSVEIGHTKSYISKPRNNHTGKEEKDKSAAKQKYATKWKDSALKCVSELQAYEEELKLRWLTPDLDQARQSEGEYAANNVEIRKVQPLVISKLYKEEQGSNDLNTHAFSEKGRIHYNDNLQLDVQTSVKSKEKTLSERLTDDIVDEAIGEISEELSSLCDEYIEHLYLIEFLDSNDPC